MNKKPVFSIVVPVYGVEDCLEKCVVSLLGQSFEDIEVILVNDGSPDKSPLLCDEYAAKDSRVVVIHKENGGLSDARNVGIDAAKGEYIIFVDSDDYIETDTCDRFSHLVSFGCDIIVGDGVSEGGKRKLEHRIRDYRNIFSGATYLKRAYESGSMPMAAWLYVYRRSFLNEKNLRFKKGITHEDDHFTPRAFLQAEKVIDSGVPFYHYVIRSGSITMRSDLRKNMLDLMETCSELLILFNGLNDKTLKKLLIDSLVVKYLNLFQVGFFLQHGDRYVQKRFVWSNARRMKTRMKALLFCASPAAYCRLNGFLKAFKGHVGDKGE